MSVQRLALPSRARPLRRDLVAVAFDPLVLLQALHLGSLFRLFFHVLTLYTVQFIVGYQIFLAFLSYTLILMSEEGLAVKEKKFPFIFALTLFAIGVTSIIYRTFNLNFPVLNAFFSLIDDSTGFLTVLCFAVIICILVRLRHNRRLDIVILYLSDIFIINKLYSNTQWRTIRNQLQAFLSSLNWQVVVFWGFVATVIIWCCLVGWKSRSRSKNSMGTKEPPSVVPDQHTTITSDSTVQGVGFQAAPNINLAAQDDEMPIRSKSDRLDETEQLGSTSEKTSPRGDKTGAHSERRRPLTVSGVLLIVSSCILAWFAMDILIYEILPFNYTPPEGIRWLLVLLQPLSVLSVGVIVAIIMWRLISKIKSSELGISETALFALLIEVVLIVVAFNLQGKEYPQILDKFLNSITDNTLIALVFVPVVLFILLHISISIIVGLLSKKKASAWLKDAEAKIIEVERGLISFVFNIIIGFINLLLFVPDFFNQIGSVLLDEDDLFPQEKIDTKSVTKDTTNQKEQTQSRKGTSK